MSLSVVLGMILSWTGGCRRPPPKAPATAPNVLIILVDTLRADKLGCYGGKLGLTPNIDRFAQQGCLFEQAFSHAPWTLPSVSSLLTSTYPATHRAGGRLDAPGGLHGLSSGVKTLAECFGSQGYQTAAIVNVLFLAPKFGISRGFESYDFQPPNRKQDVQRGAAEVTDRALAWLKDRKRAADRPFFFLVHYFDPHLTYDPPEKFRRRFALPIDQTRDPGLFGTVQDMIKLRRGRINVARLPMHRLKRLYNGEVAYTDEQIGRLLKGLHELKLDPSTLVVLTADHGEEHMDHGGFEHGHTLYDELLHIPLILRLPNVIQPKQVRATIGQIDVAPTLCSLAGIQPAPTFDGHSLEALMSGESDRDRVVLSQGNMWGPSMSSLRWGGYVFIKKVDQFELYHVAVDPRERRNLAEEASLGKLREEMSKDLAVLLKRAASDGTGDGGAVELSDADLKNLAALGYVSGVGTQNDDGDRLKHLPPARSQPSTESKAQEPAGS